MLICALQLQSINIDVTQTIDISHEGSGRKVEFDDEQDIVSLHSAIVSFSRAHTFSTETHPWYLIPFSLSYFAGRQSKGKWLDARDCLDDLALDTRAACLRFLLISRTGEFIIYYSIHLIYPRCYLTSVL